MTANVALQRTEVLHIEFTAQVLAAAVTLGYLSTGLTLVAAAGLVVLAARVEHAAALPLVCLAGPIVFGLFAQWVILRIRFDARVFAAAAAAATKNELSAADIDRALLDLGLLPRAKAGRDWPQRCAGALRLPRSLAWLTIAQTSFLLFAAVLTLR
jgi:hypothetical protein